MQHKVVCKLLLTVVYRSPFLISRWQGRPVGSLDLRALTQFSKSLPSFVQHLFLIQGNNSRHTRLACNRRAGFSRFYFGFSFSYSVATTAILTTLTRMVVTGLLCVDNFSFRDLLLTQTPSPFCFPVSAPYYFIWPKFDQKITLSHRNIV